MMALLVVLGLGGFVLWYLTKTPSNPTLVAPPKTSEPCGFSGGGVSISCGGVEYLLNKTKSLGQGTWNYTVGQILPESLRFGSTKVCRSNITGKDVWPNDIAECQRRYGVTDCNKCGGYFDLAAKKWPWQKELASETQVSQVPLLPIMGKSPGFR